MLTCEIKVLGSRNTFFTTLFDKIFVWKTIRYSRQNQQMKTHYFNLN